MNWFSRLYDKVLCWAEHRYAPYYLASVSFAESSFFPIPPDVMLVPMVLAKPQRGWFYAALTVLFSVLGAILGYVLGYYFLHLLMPWIVKLGYQANYDQVQLWFQHWGLWVIFIAGFSPIPYKLFTLSAGALHMALLPFLAVSLIGRGLRFFLVAGLVYIGGERLKDVIRRYIDYVGWLFVLAILIMLIVNYVL